MTIICLVILLNNKAHPGNKNLKTTFKKLNRNISYILAINKNK